MTPKTVRSHVKRKRASIETDKQARVNKCKAELERVLIKYKCQIGAFAYISPEGKILANIQIGVVD